MSEQTEIINEVGAIYNWLDAQIAAVGRACQACGNCCDFETYGHRLYVTSPELLYFVHFAGPEIRLMTSGVCPYRIDNKCTAYPYRFAGCRIFDCRTDVQAQNRLCESIVRQFKDLCDARQVPYRYLYLKDALTGLSENNLPLT